MSDGLKRIPWSEGTAVLILIGKRGFEAWWKIELTVIERLCIVYFVSKVMQLWRVYQELCGFDMKETFISQELYRDTLIMCSSLPQLAVAFKLFFPSKPFLPWKFSEYPLEKYYSEIRGMFGNADEFSVMEYLCREKRVESQQDVLQRGLVNRDRNKVRKSKWNHPKKPTPGEFSHLFDNSWSLSEFLEGVYKEDLKIVELFTELGMSERLTDFPLFKAKSLRERVASFTDTIDPDDGDLLHCVMSDIFADDVAPNVNNAPCEELNAAENNEEIIYPNTNASSSNQSCIEYNGKRMTLSKYVSSVKQRGDMKSSGSRNAKRFVLSGAEEERRNTISLQNLRSGSFILTQ